MCIGAGVNYSAYDLVSRYDRHAGRGSAALNLIQLRMADCASRYLYKEFIMRRNWNRNLRQFQREPLPVEA